MSNTTTAITCPGKNCTLTALLAVAYDTAYDAVLEIAWRRLPATTTAPAWIQDLLAALAGLMPSSRAAWVIALRVAVLVVVLHSAVVGIIAVGTWLWRRVRRSVGLRIGQRVTHMSKIANGNRALHHILGETTTATQHQCPDGLNFAMPFTTRHENAVSPRDTSVMEALQRQKRYLCVILGFMVENSDQDYDDLRPLVWEILSIAENQASAHGRAARLSGSLSAMDSPGSYCSPSIGGDSVDESEHTPSEPDAEP